MGKAERAKGLKYQAEITEWLEKKGWQVVNLPIGSRYQAVRDIFGADIIAKKEDRCTTLWIQATADPKASWKRKLVPMEIVPWYWPTDRVFIFVKKDKNKWVIRQLTPQGLRPFGIVMLGTLVQVKGVRFEF